MLPFLRILFALVTLLARAPDEPVLERGVSSISRGGPERTGQFSAARLPRDPVVLWKTICDQPIHDPVAAAGAVIVGDDEGTVAAYDVETGHLQWRSEQKRGQVFPAPTVIGEELLISTQYGAEALARSDGGPIWKFPIRGGSSESSPLFVDHKVIVSGKDGKIYALDPTSGQEVWSQDIVKDAPDLPAEFAANGKSGGEKARPVSASSDGTLIFQSIFDQCRVVALDVKTGERRWSFQAKGWIYMAPAVDSGRIFFSSQGNEVLGVDARTGKGLWRYPTKARVEAGAAVSSEAVFVGVCDGKFVSLDVKTGKERWVFDTSKDDGAHKWIYSAPLLLGDCVVFGSGNGFVYALKTDSGDLKWKIRPVEGSDIVSTPTTDGTRIFVTTRRLGAGQGEHALVAIGDQIVN